MPLPILPIILKGALALSPGLTAQDATHTMKHAAQMALSATPAGFVLGQIARLRDTVKFNKPDEAFKSDPEEAAWCARKAPDLSERRSPVYDCSTVNEGGVTLSTDPKVNGSFTAAAIGRLPELAPSEFNRINPKVSVPSFSLNN